MICVSEVYSNQDNGMLPFHLITTSVCLAMLNSREAAKWNLYDFTDPDGFDKNGILKDSSLLGSLKPSSMYVVSLSGLCWVGTEHWIIPRDD